MSTDAPAPDTHTKGKTMLEWFYNLPVNFQAVSFSLSTTTIIIIGTFYLKKWILHA